MGPNSSADVVRESAGNFCGTTVNDGTGESGRGVQAL